MARIARVIAIDVPHHLTHRWNAWRRRRLLIATLVAFSLSAAFAGSGRSEEAVQITFAPSRPLMDEVVHIFVRGLTPNAFITIRAQLVAPDGRRWKSDASFFADTNGVVDLAARKPTRGTYDDIDPMGLFWSMAPDATQKPGSDSFLILRDLRIPVVTHLDVEIDGRVVAVTEVPRTYLPPAVRSIEVHEAGILGRLYEPSDCIKCAVIIVLGGSEGGYPDADAAQFAAHGYAALALAYFGAPGLPGSLRNIPVEYVKRAIDWMRARPSINGRRVALVGGSRGSELALLAASRFSDVRAVVAMKPSHVLWEGLNEKGNPDGAPFVEAGRPLAYVPNHISVSYAWHYAKSRLSGTPPTLTPMFLDNLRDEKMVTPAVIPVENINGPVLLLSGADDQLWPSALMAERIMARLKARRHPFADEHIAYEGVGHFIPTAYVPVAGTRRGLRFSIGGSPAPTGRACRDAWPKILAFLRSALD